MLRATSRTTRLGVSFWNFIVRSPFWLGASADFLAANSRGSPREEACTRLSGLASWVSFRSKKLTAVAHGFVEEGHGQRRVHAHLKCARNSSIHAPCEKKKNAGRAASFSVAQSVKMASTRGPRGTAEIIARRVKRLNEQGGQSAVHRSPASRRGARTYSTRTRPEGTPDIATRPQSPLRPPFQGWGRRRGALSTKP